jgi:hypothetical protein
VTRKKISQWIRILHYILDQYGNFQCPDIIGSILECVLLLTLPFLPTPDLGPNYPNKLRLFVIYNCDTHIVMFLENADKNFIELAKFTYL